uniref:J domain-containing protein n=1 Tax=Rhodosorus marinus TaxID=101924 RepID=A0A7S0G434_9RHOD|mmetsp:Transcript_19868/g.28933  ORF Transcript_19868/g.28933 Transcript_19868/m.28933 type:complete len:274 (+) Transcript_19868:465-1286(+)
MNKPFQELGLSSQASEEEIRKAFRRKALEWHPDRHTENRAAAEQKFKEINSAYEQCMSLKKSGFDGYRAHRATNSAAGGGANRSSNSWAKPRKDFDDDQKQQGQRVYTGVPKRGGFGTPYATFQQTTVGATRSHAGWGGTYAFRANQRTSFYNSKYRPNQGFQNDPKPGSWHYTQSPEEKFAMGWTFQSNSGRAGRSRLPLIIMPIGVTLFLVMSMYNFASNPYRRRIDMSINERLEETAKEREQMRKEQINLHRQRVMTHDLEEEAQARVGR